MKIKIPDNLESPTVIIVGKGTMNEKNNQMMQKHMDSLERKLDQQYKTFIDKSDYVKVIERLHNSFAQMMDRMVTENKSMMNDSHQRKIDSLRKEFAERIKDLKSNDNDTILKSFVSKIEGLEKSIKNIPVNKPVIRVIRRDNGTLTNSFNNSLQRIENLIKKAGPRMLPSPS